MRCASSVATPRPRRRTRTRPAFRDGRRRGRLGAHAHRRHLQRALHGRARQILAESSDARRILTEHGLWLRLTRLENKLVACCPALGRNAEALAAHQRALAAAERLEPRNELLEAEVFANAGAGLLPGRRLRHGRSADTRARVGDLRTRGADESGRARAAQLRALRGRARRTTARPWRRCCPAGARCSSWTHRRRGAPGPGRRRLSDSSEPTRRSGRAGAAVAAEFESAGA